MLENMHDLMCPQTVEGITCISTYTRIKRDNATHVLSLGKEQVDRNSQSNRAHWFLIQNYAFRATHDFIKSETNSISERTVIYCAPYRIMLLVSVQYNMPSLVTEHIQKRPPHVPQATMGHASEKWSVYLDDFILGFTLYSNFYRSIVG